MLNKRSHCSKEIVMTQANSGEKKICMFLKTHSESGMPVKLPDATIVDNNTVGYLPLHPKISIDGCKSRVLKDIKSSCHISLGQLSDDVCISELDKDFLTIKNHGVAILQSTRNLSGGLYDIPIKKSFMTSNNFNH